MNIGRMLLLRLLLDDERKYLYFHSLNSTKPSILIHFLGLKPKELLASTHFEVYGCLIIPCTLIYRTSLTKILMLTIS